MYFENSEEALFRLDSCYIMFYDRFVRVASVINIRGGYVLKLQPVLPRDKDDEIDVRNVPTSVPEFPDGGIMSRGCLYARPDDPGFKEFEPFPIGYIQTADGILYCQRIPTRSIYLGLTAHSLVFMPLQLLPIPPEALRQTPLFWGSFPSVTWSDIGAAAERSGPKHLQSGSGILLVIDHDFAVLQVTNRTGLLLFEGVVVGEAELADKELINVQLSSDWGFLTGLCYDAGLPLPQVNPPEIVSPDEMPF